MTTEPVPDIGTAVAPIIAKVAPEQIPVFVAMLERSAARRYEQWAHAVDDPADSAALLACAAREDDIATRVEALYEDAAEIQGELLGWLPDLDEFGAALFDGRPILEQFSIQARGERLGVATWNSLARQTDGDAAATFLACADLEEASAVVLEGLIAGGE